MVKNIESGKARLGKVVAFNLKIPENLYLQLKADACADGFSIQNLLLLIIEKYCGESK